MREPEQLYMRDRPVEEASFTEESEEEVVSLEAICCTWS